MSARGLALALAAALAAAAPARADEAYTVGARIEPFSLDDQHGEPRAVDAGVGAILFARDMEGGGVIREALEADGRALLEAISAVYIADVSAMPALIRRVMAEPRMRRRPYPMLLDRDGETTARLPSAAGRATLIRLDGLRVAGIEQHASADALRAALEALRPADAREPADRDAPPEPAAPGREAPEAPGAPAP